MACPKPRFKLCELSAAELWTSGAFEQLSPTHLNREEEAAQGQKAQPEELQQRQHPQGGATRSSPPCGPAAIAHGEGGGGSGDVYRGREASEEHGDEHAVVAGADAGVEPHAVVVVPRFDFKKEDFNFLKKMYYLTLVSSHTQWWSYLDSI